jgi:membrane associated rhomboid family serine protease
MSTFKDTLTQYWKSGNPMFRLILLNLAVFIPLMIIRVISSLSLSKIDFYNLQFSLLKSLGVHENLVDGWYYNLYTVFTYQFVHFDFFHLLGNMIFLYFFGQIFIHLLGSKRVIPTYILGGIFGSVLYILVYNISPTLQGNIGGLLVGASASVYALAMATVFYRPHFEIHLFGSFKVKLMWVGAFFILYNLAMIPSGNNVGGLISHLGGAIFGYISILNIKSNNNIVNRFGRFIERIKSWFKPKSKMRVAYKKEENRDDYSYMDHKKAKQEEIDAILDKISKNGYDSLSKSEKEFLFKQSNEGK